MTPPVIVGAGPAGLACAATLLQAGLRPIVLDASLRPGGQGTRRLAPAMSTEATRLFGASAARAAARRESVEDRVLAACDWRPNSLVWGCFDKQLMVLREGRHDTVPYGQLLLAPGAIDRMLAFPGWTLPGVFTLGAAQVALKQHAALIGHRVVLAGASPLLYLVAVQYLRLGARSDDLVLVDCANPAQQRRAALGLLLSAPGTLWEGVRLLYTLHRAGVRHIAPATLQRALGQTRVEAVEIHHARGDTETLTCDALAFGYGLRPETQLAELAGAQFYFHPTWRDWFPVIDPDGRAGPHLWLAGDGAFAGGRVAAAASGRLAALAMLASAGHRHGTYRQTAALRRQLARLRRFQHHLARALPSPVETVAALPDATIVCRCERVTVGQVRAAASQPAAPREVNRIKALTRCGMGRCQGRFCAPTLQELLAATRSCPVADVGRLRAQAPVRPVAVASVV